MNSKEISHIRLLVDRFMDASTTLAEEKELYGFFATAGEKLPDDLEALRPMFAWYRAGLNDTAVPALTAGEKPRVALPPLRLWQWIAAAACVAILFAIGFSLPSTVAETTEINYVYINGHKITDPEVVHTETLRLQEMMRMAEESFSARQNSALSAGPPSLSDEIDLNNPAVRAVLEANNISLQ